MTLRDRIRQIFAPAVDPVIEELRVKVAQLESRTPITETLVSMSDDPDKGLTDYSYYRSLALGAKTTDLGRDFDKTQRDKILKMAHNVYALRGTAYNIIEVFVDFICGQEFYPITAKPDNAALQETLDELWENPDSNLALRHENLIRTCLLEGSLFMPAEYNPLNGSLRIGWRPPEYVEDVELDSAGLPLYVYVRAPKGPPTETVKYFVLNQLTDEMTLDRSPGGYTISETRTGVTGEASTASVFAPGICFFMNTNVPLGALFGRTELCQVLDYIDIHDELLWNEVEREKILQMFLLDIVADDVKSPEDGKRKLRELGLESPPKGPKVTIHNKRVEINLKSPPERGDVNDRLETKLRTNIYGAKGMPENWSGSGGESSLATARAQELVPLRRLRRKQREFVLFFKHIVTVMLSLQSAAGVESESEDDEWDISVLEVGGKDKQRGAAILKDLIVAISQAIADGTLKREAGNEIVLQGVREAGFDVSPENAKLPEKSEYQSPLLGELQKIGSNQVRGNSKGGAMRGGSRGSNVGTGSRAAGDRNPNN